MPSHKTHLAIDKVLLGQTFPQVHREKDNIIALMLLGRNHRVVGHDPLFNFWLAMTSKDPAGVYASATLHDILDTYLTERHGVVKPRKRKDSLLGF